MNALSGDDARDALMTIHSAIVDMLRLHGKPSDVDRHIWGRMVLAEIVDNIGNAYLPEPAMRVRTYWAGNRDVFLMDYGKMEAAGEIMEAALVASDYDVANDIDAFVQAREDIRVAVQAVFHKWNA